MYVESAEGQHQGILSCHFDKYACDVYIIMMLRGRTSVRNGIHEVHSEKWPKLKSQFSYMSNRERQV